MPGGGEQEQQIELLLGQFDRLVRARALRAAPRRRIEIAPCAWPAAVATAARRPAVGAPQHRADARDQLAHAKRLRQIVVGAAFETEHLVGLPSRAVSIRIGVSAFGPSPRMRPAHRDAVDARQHEIEDDQIERVGRARSRARAPSLISVTSKPASARCRRTSRESPPRLRRRAHAASARRAHSGSRAWRRARNRRRRFTAVRLFRDRPAPRQAPAGRTGCRCPAAGSAVLSPPPRRPPSRRGALAAQGVFHGAVSLRSGTRGLVELVIGLAGVMVIRDGPGPRVADRVVDGRFVIDHLRSRCA